MGFFGRFKTSKNDSDDDLDRNCTTMINHEEEYRKQMIKLKEDHNKMKGDEGDSDLIFNGKDNKYKKN
jgi:hypothetical protein